MSEYLASELPLITGEIPLGYDLDEGYIWRLPGSTPWSRKYVDVLSGLLASLTAAEIVRRRESVRLRRVELFDKAASSGGWRSSSTTCSPAAALQAQGPARRRLVHPPSA